MKQKLSVALVIGLLLAVVGLMASLPPGVWAAPNQVGSHQTIPRPSVVAVPDADMAGSEFAFVGSGFESGSLIHETYCSPPPDSRLYYINSFYVNATGSFIRLLTTRPTWSCGEYIYGAYISGTSENIVAPFTVLEPYRIFMPLVIRGR